MAWPKTQVKNFARQIDLQSVVRAENVNQAYDEIEAIETHLGAYGVADSPIWGDEWLPLTQVRAWGTLAARLVNIENGIKQSTTNAVLKSGGSTIQTSPDGIATKGVIGLTFKAVTGQTGNVLEVRPASSDTPVLKIDAQGNLTANKISGGTP